MKAIVPVAGKGTRLRPITLETPKPMISVAGKPIIDHILDPIMELGPTEIVFVTGYLREKLEPHLNEKYGTRTKVTCVVQESLRGTADAIWTARKAFDEDILIAFGDTIFETDLSIINDCRCDGIIWVQRVDDPSRFGVVITDADGYMVRIVEKPDDFVSDLANIGLYYVRNSRLLELAIKHVLDKHESSDDEIYLTEAFQYMIDRGARLLVVPVEGWWDCGTKEDLESTETALLSKQS